MRTVALLLLSCWGLAGASPGYPAYARANKLFVEKKLDECQAAIDEALRLDANLVPALTLKAKLAVSLNRFDIARESLDRALAVEPLSGYAQFLYGLQYYMQNDLQDALPRFEKAAALNSRDARAVLYLGLTQESLGHTAQAMSRYETALRIEQSTTTGPQIEVLLPGARLLLLLDRLDDCETWIKLALAVEPKLRDVHFEYARLLLKKEEPARAGEEGEAALLLPGADVTDAQLHYLLIRAWRAAGKGDLAAKHAEVLRSGK